jgi:hypothetical protein
METATLRYLGVRVIEGVSARPQKSLQRRAASRSVSNPYVLSRPSLSYIGSLGCMAPVRQISILLLAMLALSCGRRADVHWRDGNFEVYALDTDFSATALGYNHHPGTLGLVKEQVVAAGSTEQWVFVKRLDRTSGRTEFYIVPKKGMPENHSGAVEGPLSETQFREIRTARQLPEFTWRKQK